MLVSGCFQTVRLAELLIVVLGVSSAAPALILRINGASESANFDTLVVLGSTVSITCEDDGTSDAGVLFFNDVDATEQTTLFSRQTDGSWMIAAMSLEHQGAYRCCVLQAQCEKIAVICELIDSNIYMHYTRN